MDRELAVIKHQLWGLVTKHFEEALELQSLCLEALLGRKLTVIEHQLWGSETKHFEEALELQS